MADQDETPAKDTSDFTAAETKFLLAALKHAEGGTFKFNFDAVATELGMKDGGSVRARWNTINRKKIQAGAGGSPAGGVDKASPGKKNAKPKKADAEATTPKKRGRPAKKAATVVDEQEVTPEKDDEDMKTEGHDVGPEKGIDSEAGAGQGIKAEGED